MNIAHFTFSLISFLFLLFSTKINKAVMDDMLRV